MSEPVPSSARFRSATEFPKAIDQLNRSELNQLYDEMRECLVFTNRSRAQLTRRNQEHKQLVQQAKADSQRLQALIAQLKQEKTQIVADNQQIVAELEREVTTMATHLNRLTDVFDSVADVGTPEQSYWSVMSSPSRFTRFLQAIRAIVNWWREEQQPAELPDQATLHRSQLLGTVESAAERQEDRQNNPHLHTDPASVNRSLLDR